jgi:hypothetical protein
MGRDFDFRVQNLLGANWMGPPDMRGLANTRERKAAYTADMLMRAFSPPPGATTIAKPKYYGGALLGGHGPFGEFVRRTRYWHIDAGTASVVAFLQAHDVPAGFKGGCGSNVHFGSSLCNFSAPGNRYLWFTVQRKRDRTSILRVDADVVWVYPRSPKERVRASRVREIEFSAPNVSKKVTDPGAIARIVGWFNRIPIVPPGVGSGPGCLAGVRVRLDFRGAGGKLLAHAQGSFGICDPASVTIAGSPQPSLISPNFLDRVQRAIGVTVKTPWSPDPTSENGPPGPHGPT